MPPIGEGTHLTADLAHWINARKERKSVSNCSRRTAWFGLAIVAPLLWAQLAIADDFRVLLLNNQAEEGALKKVTLQEVELVTPSGTKIIPADQIKQLENLSLAPAAVPPKPLPIAIALRDGSQLRAADVTLQGKEATLQATLRTTQVVAAEIDWIRFQDTNATTQPQWEKLLATTSKTDRLVVLRSGDTVDTVDGLVQAIEKDEVRFDFDGDTIKAPKSRLLGITFFATTKKSYAPAKVVVTTTAGDKLAAIAIEATADRDLKLVTSGSTEFTIPWNEISKLDYSAGNLQMCADLQPLSVASNLNDDFPGDLETANKLFAPHAARYGNSAQSAEVPISDFLFLGSGELVYRVPEEMSRFQTTVTGAPNAQMRGWTTIIVQQDDEILFQQSLRPEVEKLNIDIPVVGKRRLTLKTQPDDRRLADDATWWLQPRFVK